MARRRIEFRVGAPQEEPRLSLGTLIAFASHLRAALRVQSGLPRSEIDLTGFRPGGSGVLTLAVPEVEEGQATEVLVQSLRGRAGGRLGAMEPEAAGEVREALAVLLKESPTVSVRDTTSTSDSQWDVLSQQILDELAARSQEQLAPPLMLRVIAVGEVYLINEENRNLRIRPHEGPAYAFSFAESQFARVDECRWQRARVVGVTKADEPDTFELFSIEPADSDEPDGFRIDEQRDAYAHLIAGLDALASDPALARPGWDGYTAHPISPMAVRAARGWLLMARAHAALAGTEVPAPAAVPTRGGGVQYEWRRAGAVLEVEFDPSTRLSYLLATETSDREGETTLNAACDALIDFLGRYQEAAR